MRVHHIFFVGVITSAFSNRCFFVFLCQKKQRKGGKSANSGDGMIKITSLKGAPAGIDAEVSRRDSRGHWHLKSYMDGFPDVVDPVFPERVILWESKSGLFGGCQLSYRKLPLKSAIRSPESYHKMGKGLYSNSKNYSIIRIDYQ